MSEHVEHVENEGLCSRQDRTEWGRGEWDKEPDFKRFEHAGLPCLLHRGGMGGWCGYVGVPPTHPDHGKGYDDVGVEVHGGLTYSEACGGHICHLGGEPAHWFGFDCVHGGDLAPGQRLAWRDGWYKDIGYVEAETRRLAEQLAERATLGANDAG